MPLILTRRHFVLSASALVTALTAARPVFAETAELEENEAIAKNFGYVKDVSKLDKAKYPGYTAGQDCRSCALYQGNAGADLGPCEIIPGKVIRANGWCNAWAI
jgi:rubrerythrin